MKEDYEEGFNLCFSCYGFFSVGLSGYQHIRADQDTATCGKSKGGDMCFYNIGNWCPDGIKTYQRCSSILESVFIERKPYYSLREFSSIILTGVYIPPCKPPSEKHDTFWLKKFPLWKILGQTWWFFSWEISTCVFSHMNCQAINSCWCAPHVTVIHGTTFTPPLNMHSVASPLHPLNTQIIA